MIKLRKYVTLPALLIGVSILLLTGIAFAQSEPSRMPVAYVANNTDLYVVDALTGDILYEATESSYDCPRSISPEGDWLLRSSGPDSSPRNYFLIDLNNGQQITLPHMSIDFMDWEPEGLLYSHRPNKQADRTVYRFNRTTLQAQLLFAVPSPQYPQWRSRWRYFAGDFIYITYGDNNELSIYQNGEQPISLSLSEDENIFNVAISPDTRFVLIQSDNSSHDDMGYVLDTQSGSYETIGTLSRPAWRPQSNDLSYLDDDRNLVIYNPVTQEKQHFEIERYDGYLNGYEWSPDERYFAYRVYHEGGTRMAHYRLLILDTVTRETREMVWYVSTFVGSMHWVSPTHIVYEYADADYVKADDGWMRPANADIWLYDVATGEKTQLTDTPDIQETLACMFG